MMKARSIALQGFLLKPLAMALQGLLFAEVAPPNPAPEQPQGGGGYVQPLSERRRKRYRTLAELEQEAAYQRATELARLRGELPLASLADSPPSTLPNKIELLPLQPLNAIVARQRAAEAQRKQEAAKAFEDALRTIERARQRNDKTTKAAKVARPRPARPDVVAQDFEPEAIALILLELA